jgi:phage terminase large subunit-like protein
MNAADEFAHFCGQLTTEQGRPLLLEPFQRRFLAGYFDGARETLVVIPKKNGKTTAIAALALYHCLFGPARAECVVAAASREQAGILLRQAKGFIDRSEKLARWLTVQDREIRTRDKRSRIRILAADADTADGVLPTLAIVDELHRAKSADVYAIFRDGLGPRDGQMITISTAGDSEASALGELRANARRLESLRQDGKHRTAQSVNGQFVYHEWALDPDDDRDDLDVVKEANPASWQTLEELRIRHDSPSTLPWDWARYACGVWMGADAWWLRGEDWQQLETQERIQDGDRVTVGFDGSRVADATALVMCRIEDGLLQPAGVWEAPGNGHWEVPAGELDATLNDVMTRYRVVRGYFDPPLYQSEIDVWAREYGEQAVMRYYTQRARMMAAVERFRTDVTVGKIRHAGDPQLTRHVLNAQVREARGGYWLAKSRPASPDKIDAAVAAVLAYEARADVLAAGGQRPRGSLLTF